MKPKPLFLKLFGTAMLIPTFSKHTSNGLLMFVETLKNSLTNIG